MLGKYVTDWIMIINIYTFFLPEFYVNELYPKLRNLRLEEKINTNHAHHEP